MGIEAEIAKRTAVHFEAKKDALKQVQSGDVKVTFTINPEEMPSSLYSDAMGQRYMIAVVALNDDETPKERPKEKPKSFAGQAKMLAADESFHQYVARVIGGDINPETYIKDVCGIQSCAELIEGTEAAKKLKGIQANFLQWKDF